MATSTPGKRRGKTAVKTESKPASGKEAPARKPAAARTPRKTAAPDSRKADALRQSAGLFPEGQPVPAPAPAGSAGPLKKPSATPPARRSGAAAAQEVPAAATAPAPVAPVEPSPVAPAVPAAAEQPAASGPSAAASAAPEPGTPSRPASTAGEAAAPSAASASAATASGASGNDHAPLWQTMADTMAACSGVPGAFQPAGEMFSWFSGGSNRAWPVDSGALSALQSEYVLRFNEMFERYLSGASPELKDRRFADKAWHEQPAYGWQAAWYLFNSEFLKRSAELFDLEDKARERLRFSVQQWIDAMSPANFLATNPEALNRMIETNGESLRQGIHNLLHDMQQGRISQTDTSAFEVGRNVCVTPGTVVFENELVQLIQYQPTTGKVGARPLLVVPPAINKFYILDLQPGNSFIGHAVAEGHTVFVVSWRNIKDEKSELGWDDYLQLGVVDPIHVVQEISGQPDINMLGFCVGGTLLATALAALASKGERPAASLTLLTTLLDFTQPGVLGVFIDEMHVAMREQTIGKRGIMPGKELATTFSFLRPNELVWNYVVGNYLKGESPVPFDLLYWNSDSTNLAGPMFCTYLRHTYLQNELVQAGKFRSLGVPVDLQAIDVPTYALCAREDHIVPWQGGYLSAQALGGNPRFVLTASGHIAGVVNPPAKKKRSYQVGGPIEGRTPEQWLAETETHPGSWWEDWYQWLAAFKGESIDAPAQPGSAKYPPIEPAPGRYVKEKA